MAEKRSTGWGKDRDTKSFFDAPAVSPKRRQRSFLKPGMAISYVYATIVIVVWQLWPHPAEPVSEPTMKPTVQPESDEGKDLKDRKDHESEKLVASTVSKMVEATRAQIFMQDVMPGVSLEPFQSAGHQFSIQGDHLDASWGWMYQGTSGLVGDQRKEATKGFIPNALKAYRSSIGWQNLFEFSLQSGEKVSSKDCSLIRSARLRELRSESEREKGELRIIGGEALELRCKALFVQWTGALLRLAGGAEVLRTRMLYRDESDSPHDSPVGLTVWDFDGSSGCHAENCLGASGEVDGSPLIDPGRGMWIAMEHPRAVHGLRNGTVVAELFYPSSGIPYFASLGAAGMASEDALVLLRRHFHAYLDQVRVSIPKPFLHYSTWYDLRRHPCIDSTALGLPHCSAARTLNEHTVEQRIQEIHERLLDRGVELRGTSLDDGWDDAGLPWQVDRANFPSGLGAIARNARSKGVSLGVWMSPSGGFGEGGKRRVKTATALGFESHGDTLRLSGPLYFDWFSNATASLLSDGVRFFKFDGLNSRAEDVDTAILLISELRRTAKDLGMKEEVKSSGVTGVWPSPWWLSSVDFVWRGGPDLGRETERGSARQQWITFRDSTLHRLLQKAQLFPLSSLSTGGLVWSTAEEPGAYLNSFDIGDFAQDVQSFFLSGAMHQELQIQPSLLSTAHWDILASYINVSLKYSSILRHSHWMGGDPSQNEVYGYGAYDCPPCLGLMTWRNPSAESQNFTFTLRKALSLPKVWPGGAVGGRWHVRGIAESEVVGAENLTWEAVLLDQVLHLQLEALQLRSFKVEQVGI